MPKCDLRIEPVGGVDHVRPGGTLDVVVHVETDGKIGCNALTLTRLWRTHGKGNQDSGGKEARSLFSGTWEAGHYEYPATVEFPKTPESYHGTVVNVDWYLEVRADVPFKLDPKAELQVLVVNTDPPRAYEAPDVWSPTPVKLEGGMMGCMMPAIVGMGIAAGLAYAGWMIAAALLGALCLYGVYGSRKAKRSAQGLGHVALDIHPRTLAPGETLSAMLEIQPETARELTSIRASLRSTETGTSGSGSSTTTYNERAVDLEETAGTHVRLDPLSTYSHEFQFTLPVETPPTFESSDNELSTTLTLFLGIEGEKEFHFTQPITIRSTAPDFEAEAD